MPTLQNKVIVITGSTRGFGLATAQACLAAGATVAVTGRSQEAVDRALNGMQAPGKTAGFVVDVREEAQVHHLAAQVIQKFGHFDIWINNAGYSSAAGMVLDMNPREALDMFMSNDLGAMHGTQAAMQHFLARKAGLLVNIYGNGSFLRPATPTAMYGTTKAWLTSFTRSLAKENAGSGVRILGFSPGMMTTDMLTSPRVVGEKAQAQMKNFGFVLRFLGKPAEVAAKELVKSISTQRKEFVEVQMFKPWTPLLGLLRVGWENLTKTGKTPEFTLTIEPAYEYRESVDK
jgi:NAD(P)-dependent dehydrogenase (short-subunit alcohol dehydrogenase family)